MSITCHVQIDKFILKNNNSMIQCVTCNNSSLFAPKQEKNKYFEITKKIIITCTQNTLQKMYIVHNHTKLVELSTLNNPRDLTSFQWIMVYRKSGYTNTHNLNLINHETKQPYATE
jgi:hypothetical protein